ncbi:MAG: hypothetical protein GC190_10765 [Alphaproteobacteria bacterium]|nr:hypothetical protein [Alphaproteobacteria bacterium]
MTTRLAVRQAIASGQAGEVKATLNDHEMLLILKQYLQVPDDQLVAHLRRLADELGAKREREPDAT